MEKQRFLEKCRHGTPRFPIECFQTYSDSKHFVVPMHWHKNVEIMQTSNGKQSKNTFHPEIKANYAVALVQNRKSVCVLAA